MKITHRIEFDAEQLSRIGSWFTNLTKGVLKMTQEVDDLVQTVTDLVAAVTPLAPAIDKLEAAITAATGMSPADKQKLVDALAALKGVKTSIDTAVADANDNIDEGAAPPAGGPA